MKTPKAIKKRDRILLSAAEVLAEKGYSSATLTDIALSAGTFAGSLYYYYTSKEDIVEDVLNTGTTSISNFVMAKVMTLGDDISPVEKLRIGILEHFKLMLECNPFTIAYWKIIDQVPEDMRRKHLVLPKAYGHFWVRLISEAQAHGELRADLDANTISLLIIGSTVYALRWFRPGRDQSAEQICNTLIEMCFNGLLPNQGAVGQLATRKKRANAGPDQQEAIHVLPTPAPLAQRPQRKARGVGAR